MHISRICPYLYSEMHEIKAAKKEANYCCCKRITLITTFKNIYYAHFQKQQPFNKRYYLIQCHGIHLVSKYECSGNAADA